MNLLNELKMVSSQSYDAIKDINPSESFDDSKYSKYVYAIDSINSAVDSINEFIDNTHEIRQALFTILGKFKETIEKIKTFADKISNFELSNKASEVVQVVDNIMAQSQFEPTILGAPVVPGRPMQQEQQPAPEMQMQPEEQTIQRDKPKVRTLTPNYNTFRNAA